MGFSCPLCASAEADLFLSIEAGDNCFEKRYRLYTCGGCGVVFTHPIPCDADIQSLYGEDYYSFSSQSLESLPFWKYVAKTLFPMVRSLHSKKSRYAMYLERILFVLARNVPQTVPLFFAGSEVLDVGCGAGDQIALWQEAGFSAQGVDTSPLAAAEGARKGLKIFAGELWEAGFADDLFDICYANHVIEHTGEPHAMLKEIWRVLKPGGVLVAGVPNLDSSLFALFKSKWFHLDVPRHLLHFSPASLAAMLAQDGFAIGQLYTITPAGGLLGSLGNMLPWFEALCGDRRFFVFYVAAYILLTLLLLPSNLGLKGDWLYAIAVKDA
jgi:SAM-dependent methyltransferase